MKIAMIGHKYIPSRVGGIKIVVDELAKGLVLGGHEVHVYNRFVPWQKKFYPDANPAQKTYEGMRLIWVPTFARSSLNAPVYSCLASLRALVGGYDIVHIHAEGPAALSWLFRLFGIPVVVTIHGLDWQRAKWGRFAKNYLLFGQKCAAKIANAIIVLTKATQEYFTTQYGRETVLIPNATARGKPAIPNGINQKWGLQKGGYLLFLARLVPEKGLHYLIEAYFHLRTSKKLVIAGALDRDDRYIQKIIELAARDPRILLTDFVTGEMVAELYSNCAMYILPSDVEGMAISLLEALSFGCRCVLSDIPENSETAGEFGVYFKQGDAEDLRRVLEAELRRAVPAKETEEQLRFVDARYSWSRVVRETTLVYREFVHENNHGK